MSYPAVRDRTSRPSIVNVEPHYRLGMTGPQSPLEPDPARTSARLIWSVGIVVWVAVTTGLIFAIEDQFNELPLEYKIAIGLVSAIMLAFAIELLRPGSRDDDRMGMDRATAPHFSFSAGVSLWDATKPDPALQAQFGTYAAAARAELATAKFDETYDDADDDWGRQDAVPAMLRTPPDTAKAGRRERARDLGQRLREATGGLIAEAAPPVRRLSGEVPVTAAELPAALVTRKFGASPN